MNAIILAAGEGKRLRSLTKNKPKCMIKLFGKSLLEWQIQNFLACKISDISIVTGYLGYKIKFSNINYFENSRYNLTNMVETLFCAKEKLMSSTIVSYGDIIYEKKVLKKLINATDELSVTVDLNWKKYWKMRFKDPLEDAESLMIDSEGYIKDIGQKTKKIKEIQGQYIGLMKFQNSGIEFLKDFYKKAKAKSKKGVNLLNPSIPFEQSYMTDLLQALIKEGCKIKAVPIKNGWLELDSFNDYQLYQDKYNTNTISQFIKLDK